MPQMTEITLSESYLEDRPKVGWKLILKVHA